MKRERLQNMTEQELKEERRRVAAGLVRQRASRPSRNDQRKYLERLNKEIYLRQFKPTQTPEDPRK